MNIQNTKIDSSIVTTLDFCRNIPRPPTKQISRDHLLEEVKRTLDGRAEIIVLVGDSLTGKSEFVAEYFRRQPSYCLGIFLNPEAGLFRSADYIRLAVAEQISWIVDKVHLSVDVVTEELYQRYLYKLQKVARRNKITWIIDGLGQKRIPNLKEINELTEIIPFGTRDFDFIITSEFDLLPHLKITNRVGKVLEIMLVSPDEARQFFFELVPIENDVQEIRSFCQSSIGRMQRIRSLLLEGVEISELLEKGNESLDALFEFEWQLIPENIDLHFILALITFSSQPLTLEQVTNLSGLNKSLVENLISECRLINTSKINEVLVVVIESKALSYFISKRLNSLEKRIREVVIADLLTRSQSREATQFLPLHLAEAGRHVELIGHLDAAHFGKLLEAERSLKSLRQHAAYGYKAARSTGDYGSEIAFSLISSVVTGLTFSVGTVEQISVLIKLGLQDAALEIASIAPTAEERLRLLASAASSIIDQGGSASSDLRSLVQSLVDEVDCESLGDLGVAIASDLITLDVKLADSLIKRVINGAKRSDDTAVGKSSDVIIEVADVSMTEAENPSKRRNSRIADHKLARYATALSHYLQKAKGESLIENIKSEDPALALLLAKQWLLGNRKNSDSFMVADAALDFLLSSTSRTPQLEDLRQISEVLSYLNTSERIRLTARLETQYRVIGHHGTTADSVRLRMEILRAKYLESTSDVELSLIDLHSEIHALTDLSTRATCWAWLLNHLYAFKDKNSLEVRTGIISDASTRLEETVTTLFSCSADHFQASKEAIQAIARNDPVKAFDLVARINTRENRDQAYELLARTLVSRHASSSKIIVSSVDSISNDLLRDELTIDILQEVQKLIDKNSPILIAEELLNMWQKVGIASHKLRAVSATFVIQRQLNQNIQAARLIIVLEEVWKQIQSTTGKVHLGYIVASEVATVDTDLARVWLAQVKTLLNESSTIASRPVMLALYSTVRLATRLFPSIYQAGLPNSENIELRRLDFLVTSVSDNELQLRLWTDLAVRMHFAGFTSVSKFICEERITPALDLDHTHNCHFKDILVCAACPALFLVHQGSALHRIDSLGRVDLRDEARSTIVKMLLRGVPPQEPHQSSHELAYSLSQNVVVDSLNLLKGCQTDSTIFSIVKDLCSSLAADKNRSKIQRNAALEYLRSMKEIINKLLPDCENIRHDGFLISCHALIDKASNTIQQNSAANVNNDWENLFSRARAINNVADRAVVTAMVGVNSKVKPGSIVHGWLQNVKDDIPQIPTAHDRLHRYEWIAEIVEPVDKPAARILISEGMNLSNIVPRSDNVADQQRRLLDLAHALDASLANELLERLDGDEARKEPLKKRLEANIKRKALASRPNTSELDGLDDEQVSDLCRRNLASLVAARIPVRPIEEFMELNRRARSMAVSDAYPVWAWILENAVRRKGGLEVEKLCAKLFEASCKASEIAHALIGRIAQSAVPDINHGTIKGGEREVFLRRLRDWAIEQDGKQICISDPYFGPSEIEVLKIFAEAAPRSTFRILTSREHIKKKKLSSPEDAFRDAWEEAVDVDPPDTQIGMIGFGIEGKHPIHDRWIVVDGSGLTLGSSINSIGLVRTSDVSVMSSGDAANKYIEINSYFDSPPRSFRSERLITSKFTL